MCGIAGLFSKSSDVEERLGAHLSAMLSQLADRGPDSAGVALYRDPAPPGSCKVSLFSPRRRRAVGSSSSAELAAELRRGGEPEVRASHALFVVAGGAGARSRRWLARAPPRAAGDERRRADRDLQGGGRPARLRRALRARRRDRRPTRSGHTRMATESRVTTEHSHPFSTGLDLCLVHNGSLSNHNRLRMFLRRQGIEFQTDNDTEVAAGYLTWRLSRGRRPRDRAARAASTTSTASTPSPSAPPTGSPCCATRSPASRRCMAETDDWVAMASEYRAIAVLPGRRGGRAVGARAGPRLLLGAGEGSVSATRPSSRSTSRPRRSASSTSACTTSSPATRPTGGSATRTAPTRSRSGSTPRSRSRSTGTSATTAPA